MKLYIVVYFVLAVYIFSLVVNKTCETFENPTLKNIYGEPLKKCRNNNSDNGGSWDNSGYCSEKGGGVHQICMNITDKTKDFAKDTYQRNNWSNDRIKKNHCMCLGAWSLYKARQDQKLIEKTSNELVCESIPKMSFSPTYINKWNNWNDKGLDNQIKNGIDSLYEQCMKKGNDKQKKYLKQLCNTLNHKLKNILECS